MHRALRPLASLVPLFALVGCAETTDSDTLDATADTKGALVACDDGALVLRASSERDGEFTVTIADASIVEALEARAGAAIEGRSSSGEPRTVEAALPAEAAFETLDDGTRTLVLRGLRASEGGSRYATSSLPGSSVAWVGRGMRLALGNASSTATDETIYYDLGAWDFASCEARADEPVVRSTTDRYCGDPIFDDGAAQAGEAPRIVGFDAWYSSHAKVAQAIEKYGDHALALEYLDGADEEKFMGEVDAILRYGHTSICFDARFTELSAWGTPTAVRPIAVVKPTPQ
jgi:hypothetical protein